VKDFEFKMRTTRITGEIFPNEVIAFSEKCPGREDGETAEVSVSAFLIFGNTSKVSIEKQSRQQPNAVYKSCKLDRERKVSFKDMPVTMRKNLGIWAAGSEFILPSVGGFEMYKYKDALGPLLQTEAF
jgi:hypothetical protein